MTDNRYETGLNAGDDALGAAHGKGGERKDMVMHRRPGRLKEGEGAETGTKCMGEEGHESAAYDTGCDK